MLIAEVRFSTMLTPTLLGDTIVSIVTFLVRILY